ncbi:hypothetical protein [Pedobacter sp. P26]
MKKAINIGMIMSRPITITAAIAISPNNSIDRFTVRGKLFVIKSLF